MPKSYVIAAVILSILLLILGISIWNTGSDQPEPVEIVPEETITTSDEVDNDYSAWQELPEETEEPETQDVTRILFEGFDEESLDGVNVREELSGKVLLDEEIVEQAALEKTESEQN
ncbi:hypothetical protein ACWJJH_15925 [Endozoicomonadaceae bacterium StTr2]